VPDTPAGRKVNADGCELDGDGDGIVDGADKCPTVYAKTADGCPPPLVLEGVHFDNDKATLRQESFAILDKTAVSLKDWGDVNIEVGGHTDSRADDDYNLKLSQRRAETVRDYPDQQGYRCRSPDRQGLRRDEADCGQRDRRGAFQEPSRRIVAELIALSRS